MAHPASADAPPSFPSVPVDRSGSGGARVRRGRRDLRRPKRPAKLGPSGVAECSHGWSAGRRQATGAEPVGIGFVCPSRAGGAEEARGSSRVSDMQRGRFLRPSGAGRAARSGSTGSGRLRRPAPVATLLRPFGATRGASSSSRRPFGAKSGVPATASNTAAQSNTYRSSNSISCARRNRNSSALKSSRL